MCVCVFFLNLFKGGNTDTKVFWKRCRALLDCFRENKRKKKKMGQSYDSLNTAREAYIRRGSYFEEKYQRQEEGKNEMKEGETPSGTNPDREMCPSTQNAYIRTRTKILVCSVAVRMVALRSQGERKRKEEREFSKASGIWGISCCSSSKEKQ